MKILFLTAVKTHVFYTTIQTKQFQNYCIDNNNLKKIWYFFVFFLSLEYIPLRMWRLKCCVQKLLEIIFFYALYQLGSFFPLCSISGFAFFFLIITVCQPFIGTPHFVGFSFLCFRDVWFFTNWRQDPPAAAKITAHLIVILILLRWPGAKPAISTRCQKLKCIKVNQTVISSFSTLLLFLLICFYQFLVSFSKYRH